MEEVYDVLILGAGPAGLTAAIYSARYNHKVLVVGKNIGGTMNLAGVVENWPGYIGPGAELMKNIRKQAEKFGAEILEDEVNGVKKNGNLFVLDTDCGEVLGKSLIVALGTEHRQLNIPGEKKLLGKGVSYSANSHGHLFKDKVVAVIGGANSAAKAAIYLSDICKRVYIIYRKNEMRCEPISLSKICKTPNIEIKYFSNPVEVVGEKNVEGLKIKIDNPDKSSTEEVIDVSGVFVEVGATPVKEVVEKLKLKIEKNYIVTGKDAKTNIEGVFAAGDVTNNYLKQMVSASGEGAIAAKAAHEFLMKDE